MKGQLFTVNSRKFDLSLRRSWKAHLVERTDDHITLEGSFEFEVEHSEIGIISKGTRSVETFFFDRWYNYFVFYEPSGGLRNYYFNISLPPRVGRDIIDYVDLDIDIIVWPDRRIEVLDEEEFRDNALVYAYPAEVIAKTEELKSEISKSPEKFVGPAVSTLTSLPEPKP